LRGWGALLAAVVAYVLLAIVDRDLKAAPHAGFCPDEAAWVLAAPDWPLFWQRFRHTDLAAVAGEELPQWLHQTELLVRKATGIRPTPSRWQTWLGSQLLLSGTEGRWGLCVRPGLLLNASHCVNRLLPRGTADGTILRYGGLHYAWRDGFLLVSNDPDYVRRLIDAPIYGPLPRQDLEGATLAWRHPLAGELHLRASDGAPVSGYFTAAVAAEVGPLHLPDAWQDRPLLVLAGHRWQDLGALVRVAKSLFRFLPEEEAASRLLTSIAAPWLSRGIPQPSGAEISEYAVAVLGVDVSETLPVPELVAVLRTNGPAEGPHPLSGLLPEDTRQPYAWSHGEGWLAPVWGEKGTLCLAAQGDCWLAATQEPVMERVLGRLKAEDAVDADLSLRLDWEEAGRTAALVLQEAARRELLPRADSRDTERDWAPWARAMSRMGVLEIDARAGDGVLEFEGFLARHGAGTP